jgi:two-component system NtrC family sensor kinase
MRYLLILSLVIGMAFPILGQDFTYEYRNYGDSLYRKLELAPADTAKVILWTQLGNFHKFSRPDSGIYYSSKAISLSRSIGYLKGEAMALHNLSVSYSTLGDHNKAVRISRQELKIAEQLEDQGEIIAFTNLNLGLNFFHLGDLKSSAEYYREAISLFLANENFNLIAISKANLSRTLNKMNQLDSSFKIAHESKELAERINSDLAKTISYLRLGEIHRNLGNLDSALFYFKKSYDHNFGNNSGQAYRALEIAKLFQDKNQLDSSLIYANISLDMAFENNLYDRLTDANLYFVEFYKNKDPIRALKHSQLSFTYSDSLSNFLKMSSFIDFEDFDEQLRQYELDTAKSEYQFQLRTNIFLGSTFTLLIIAFFLYRNNRQKQKSKLQIEGAYNQLKSTQAQLIQSEKMASLGELTAGIAHEIQNPLNFVNNFSELNSELVKEAEEELEKGDIEETKFILKDLGDNSDKITFHGKRADAIIKGMLEHSKRGSGQKEPTNLNGLADEFLRLSYQSFLAKEPDFKCELKTDLASDLPQVSVIPQDIGKVLLNLINNAFYAVNEKASSGNVDSDYKPIVTVSSAYSPLQGGKGGRVELSVQDNGSGIPDSIKEKIFQPFFTTKPTGSGTGLGLSLSYDIVKAHGGELRVESSPAAESGEIGGGTVFTFYLPNPQSP